MQSVRPRAGGPDSFPERAMRAVQGRRGCRETKDIEARYEILAFVVWHRRVQLVCDQILVAEGQRPGVTASWLYGKFEREFIRERAQREEDEHKYGGGNRRRGDGTYRHEWMALDRKVHSDLRTASVTIGRGLDRVPAVTPGLTFGYRLKRIA